MKGVKEEGKKEGRSGAGVKNERVRGSVSRSLLSRSLTLTHGPRGEAASPLSNTDAHILAGKELVDRNM